jgi:hypothetical protein
MDNCRTAIDTITAKLNSGVKKLTINSDRYLWAAKKNFDAQFARGFSGRVATYNIQFVCADPYWYSTTTTTQDETIAGDATYTYALSVGNALVYPVITITPSGSMTEFQVTNNNTNVNRFVRYTGTVGAGVALIIDCAERTVTVGTNTNGLNNMTGDFIWLMPNANNALAVSGTGINTGANGFTVVYTERWY